MSKIDVTIKNILALSADDIRVVRLKKICSIVLTSLISLTGILYIILCTHLYYTGGNSPYSAERVSNYLIPLIPISIITVLGAIFSGILAVIYPQKSKLEPLKSASYALMRGEKRGNTEVSDATRVALSSEVGKRTLIKLATGVVVTVCVAVSLLISLNFSRYSLENINGDIIGVAVLVLPLVAIAVASVCVCYYLCERSCEASLEIYSSAKHGEVTASSEGYDKSGMLLKAAKVRASVLNRLSPIFGFIGKNEETILLGTRVVLGVVSVVFIIVGIGNGGMDDVLAKAVKICTECIGLG